MKKLLLIAILMLALVFTVVACTETPAGSDTTAADTTAETPTDAPTEEATTEAPTEEEPTEEVTTEAPTEEVTTEAPTEAPTAAPTEEPTEAPTADPADPVWIIEPDDIAGITTVNNASIAKTDDGFAAVSATGGDPWIMAAGYIGDMPEYLAIRYRTNTDKRGEIFTSDAANPAGGKSFVFDYNANGEWNLLIFHLPTVAPYLTSSSIGHIRYDFFVDVPAEGTFLEVAYMAFFNTAEYALAYDFEQYPPYIEAADAAAGKVGHSFDTFYVNGSMYFEADGGAGDKLTAQNNTVTFALGEAHDSLALRGWIGFGQTMDQFGYFVDNYEFVFGEFKQATEAGVLAAGGENASRFQIEVPLADLSAGSHMIGFVVKLADGTVVRLRENLTVVIPDENAIPDTTLNVTVNAADNFAADAAADATVPFTNSNLKDVFTTVFQAAGDPSQVINAADGAYYKAQGFSEAFRKMDGTYAYTVHSLASSHKKMSSFFIRGAQSVKPLDTTGITNVLNNYFETDGQSDGHAGAGIQLWNHKRLLLGVKYYDESALTKIGTAYWLIEIDCQGKDVQVIDNGSMIYITVDGVLAATVELVGSGKSYDGLTVTGDVTFCEKAIVTMYRDLKDDYGFTPDENGQYVVENTLVVDTPMSDVGIATRTGTLDFTTLSIAPLSTVEIPKIPTDVPSFPGNASNFSVCADNVRTWVGETYTDLCTQEAHKYMAEVEGTINVTGLDAISFRGWANPTVGGLEIAEFGYQIGMNDPVFSADFWQDEPELNAALNSPVAKRFEGIKIPVADLAAGTYDVYLLVKDTNGVIYCMNATWGAIQIVKD